MTVFGYGAPSSDVEAVQLLKTAWLAQSDRTMEHVEVIDIQPVATLTDRWGEFTPTHHFQSHTGFAESRISRWPRRTRESLYYPMVEGRPCRDFPLPASDNLSELQRFCAEIARLES